MKIHVMSDTHLEHYHPQQRDAFFYALWERAKKDKPDCLVIAGDFCVINGKWRPVFVDGMKRVCGMYDKVYYVPGNHEYWGGWVEQSNEFLAELSEQSWVDGYGKKLVVMLADGIRQHDTVSIAGGTLWYNEDKGTDFIDYDRTYDAERSIPDAHNRFLRMPLHETDIVVSHHFPTDESIAPEWFGYASNDFFCARIEEHLGTLSGVPKLWIHGHTHGPMDYVSRFGFRVYCNPYGYPKEGANPQFWEKLLLEVDFSTESGKSEG